MVVCMADSTNAEEARAIYLGQFGCEHQVPELPTKPKKIEQGPNSRCPVYDPTTQVGKSTE
jgi:hypothetical protein